MEHKKDLDELNKQKLQKIEEYLKTKNKLTDADKMKLEHAHDNWQKAWAKYLDVLVYLESLEI